jgi:cellulose synthase/poly-beta-1,6-N-acetylglucosamine synthase-like glycosyltransferase
MNMLLVIFCFSLISYLFYVGYFIVGWLRTPSFQSKDKLNKYPTISIIIPVRNEEEHIGKLLTDIQSQTYPEDYIEVLVINDDSTDDTLKVIKELNYSNVKVLDLQVNEKINAYKKRAITLGVQHSSAELIVTTDGDCRVGPHWLMKIVEYYIREDKQLITAPVSYHLQQNWFEKVQTVEFQFLIAAAAACIKNGMPNTCNGANMAYKRELFHEIKGYDGIDNVASGDDEMLLHKVFKKDPSLVGFLKSDEAIVKTFAKSDWRGFIQQRKRWASKSTIFFDYRTSLMLASVFMLNVCLLVALPLAFFFKEFFVFLSVAAVLKFLFDGFLIFQTLRFFSNKKLLPYLLLVEFLYTPYIVFVGIVGNFSSTYIWKGRAVR